MVRNAKPPIQIDLAGFKLYLYLKNRIHLTLHFNSPSRRFYLAVIALVVNEMKKLGSIKSIPLQEHLDLLVLLNESIGDTAGSSDKENLLPRIYRKWKDALPNLEEAPLFRVLGRKREDGEGAIGKVYPFSDVEKDGWANLFEYMGSEENVRLKFAIDKIGLSLNEISITFGDFQNDEAWDQFIFGLEKGRKEEPEAVEEVVVPGPPVLPSSPHERPEISWFFRYRWVMLMAVIGIVAGGVAISTIYFRRALLNGAPIERMMYPLPDKPSIVVLPFVNISEDPKQELFSDGLTEEITNALSRLPQIFVIARNSSFTYKGKAVNVKRVGREMGVQYVVEGSVRREGNRIRITAQLIDSTTGRHVFSERYDRELKDIFAMQDDIAIKILTALRIALTDGEWALLQAKGVSNVEAYFKLLEAREQHEKVNKESNDRARRLAEEALHLDPGSSAAYATLAYAHFWDYWLGPPKSPEDSIQQGIALAQKSIALDNNPRAHGMLAMLYVNKGDYDLAVQEGELAASMDPGFLTPWGSTLMHASRHSEAIAVFQKVLRVNPVKPPTMCLANLARSYQMIGKYEEAIRFYKKLLQDQPNHLPANSGLTATYSMMGRMEEAGAQAREVLRISPKFSLERWAKTLRFKNPEDVERYIDALRKAGLK
jgi:TolB-like protein